MTAFEKIDGSSIKAGMRFSAPIFFADGKNMFLAEGKAARQYHVDAVKRWNIPFLLTCGRLLSENEPLDNNDISELEEVDELEPVDEL
ncbi:MAG: phosphohydrolase [Treponema sp.]|nr:phosphohydrolase [Treponema sp.]